MPRQCRRSCSPCRPPAATTRATLGRRSRSSRPCPTCHSRSRRRPSPCGRTCGISLPHLSAHVRRRGFTMCRAIHSLVPPEPAVPVAQPAHLLEADSAVHVVTHATRDQHAIAVTVVSRDAARVGGQRRADAAVAVRREHAHVPQPRTIAVEVQQRCAHRSAVHRRDETHHPLRRTLDQPLLRLQPKPAQRRADPATVGMFGTLETTVISDLLELDPADLRNGGEAAEVALHPGKMLAAVEAQRSELRPQLRGGGELTDPEAGRTFQLPEPGGDFVEALRDVVVMKPQACPAVRPRPSLRGLPHRIPVIVHFVAGQPVMLHDEARVMVLDQASSADDCLGFGHTAARSAQVASRQSHGRPAYPLTPAPDQARFNVAIGSGLRARYLPGGPFDGVAAAGDISVHLLTTCAPPHRTALMSTACRLPLYVTAALLACATPGFGQSSDGAKKPLDHDAYDRWKRIDAQAVSNDGRWALYSVA